MYSNGAIVCGQGKEVMRHPSNSSLQSMYKSNSKFDQEVTCDKFWWKLDTNRCTNLHIGEDDGTWCYVDPTCETLNGGGKSEGQLAWKKCSKGDQRLRDYEPDELLKQSKHLDIWFGGLHKLAYPGARAGESPTKMNISDLEDGIPTWVTTEIEAFGESGKPYWFDTNSKGLLPTVLVHGNKAYKVEDLTDQDSSTTTQLTCIVGC